MPIATINPATAETVRRFDALSAPDIERKVRRAHDAFATWSRTPLEERVAVVRRAGMLLEERKDAYGRLMTLEMGKLLTAAREEAAKCALACRHYADHAREMLADEQVTSGEERGYIAFHPLGVVLAVMPWNFPFWQVIRFAAPALVAGNTALLKHASTVPQCAVAIEQLFIDAGAPPGVFQTLLIGSDAVAGLLADDRIAAVSLTGSENAGRSVAGLAGQHLKRSLLELGGSDPFIVMPTADLMSTIQTAVRARVINNGQSCIAAKRFIVHERVARDFEAGFVEAIRALRVGDPLDPDTQVGPLAGAQLVDDLEKQVDESVRRGARVLTGGHRLKRPGFFFEPTVLVDARPGSPAYDEELFGPVASLFTAGDAADAIRIANDTRYGLASSVWTREPSEVQRFTRELQAGTVFVNGMVSSDPRFPFGGVKASGYGRELGVYGLREFVNVKTVRVFGMGASGGGPPHTLAE